MNYIITIKLNLKRKNLLSNEKKKVETKKKELTLRSDSSKNVLKFNGKSSYVCFFKKNFYFLKTTTIKIMKM